MVAAPSPTADATRLTDPRRTSPAANTPGKLTPLVTVVAPGLVALPGVGVDTAGQLLVTAGDNPGRLRNEQSFARLCGVAPVPVSSGRTDRHRLHRGGDRDANSALWRIALVRMHCHQPTKDYVARRIAEGRTKKSAPDPLAATLA